MLVCYDRIPKSIVYGEFMANLAPTVVRRSDTTDDSLKTLLKDFNIDLNICENQRNVILKWSTVDSENKHLKTALEIQSPTETNWKQQKLPTPDDLHID